MRETGCAYRPRMLATFHCGRSFMLMRMDSLFLSLESSENKGRKKHATDADESGKIKHEDEGGETFARVD